MKTNAITLNKARRRVPAEKPKPGRPTFEQRVKAQARQIEGIFALALDPDRYKGMSNEQIVDVLLKAADIRPED